MVASLALLTLTLAWGAPRVHPERGDGPDVAQTDEVRAIVAWEGGPATIAVRQGVRWRTLATDTTSPYRTPPLAPGTPVRVRTRDQVAELVFDATWTPADVASWSGPGLRGAKVTDLAPTPLGLWVATDGGGIAWWNGERWSHLDRRLVLPDEHPVALAVSEDVRWVAHEGAVVRLDPDGTAHWMLPGEEPGVRVEDLVTHEQGAVWEASGTGVRLLAGDEVAASLRDPTCHRVLGAPDVGFLAACDAVRRLPHGEVVRGLPDGLVPSAWVLRVGGAWVASREQGLGTFVNGVYEATWAPPRVAVEDAVRIGSGLLLAAGEDGAFVLDEAGEHTVTPARGAPPAPARLVAPGPTSGKAWLGTDAGVALVTAAGTATPLPMAPLPAGVPVHTVVPTARGVGVASAGGLAWLGRGRPHGFDSLVAAVGSDARDLVRLGRDWWALGAADAWRLTPKGELERWPLHGRGVAMLPARGGLALITRDGIRWWLPEARLLSPLQAIEGVRAASVDSGGTFWLVTDTGVVRAGVGGMQSWTVPGAVQALPLGPGAVVATDQGVAWITAGVEEIGWGWLGADTGPVTALATWGGALRVAGADGRVWTGNAEAPTPYPFPLHHPASRIHRWIPDEAGAWVATSEGLFRVRDP